MAVAVYDHGPTLIITSIRPIVDIFDPFLYLNIPSIFLYTCAVKDSL